MTLKKENPSIIVLLLLTSYIFTPTTIEALISPNTNHEVEEYLQQLKSNDINLKRFAGKQLGSFTKKKVIHALIKELKTHDQQLLSHLRQSLIKLKKHSTHALIQALKNPNANIKKEASTILGKIKINRALPHLHRLLKHDRNIKVRTSAASAIGNIGKLDSINILIDALKDPHWPVRVESSKALGKIPHTKSIQPLIRVLYDKNSYVRMHAAISLGKIRSIDSLPALIKRLSDKNIEVQISCIWALGKIGNKQALKPLLLMFMENINEHIRIEIAGALLHMGYNKEQIDQYLTEL